MLHLLPTYESIHRVRVSQSLQKRNIIYSGNTLSFDLFRLYRLAVLAAAGHRGKCGRRNKRKTVIFFAEFDDFIFVEFQFQRELRIH